MPSPYPSPALRGRGTNATFEDFPNSKQRAQNKYKRDISRRAATDKDLMASNDLKTFVTDLSSLVLDFVGQFREREKVLFRFTESRSFLGVGVALLLTGAAVWPMLDQDIGWAVNVRLFGAIAVVFAIATLITFGLRTSLVVTATNATIKKKWFFIPYRSWSARKIDEVSYGGDWGKSDYPAGVVVRLGNRDIHIGSGKTMHELYTALLPLCSEQTNALASHPLQQNFFNNSSGR